MHLNFKGLILSFAFTGALTGICSIGAYAQETQPSATPVAKPSATPAPSPSPTPAPSPEKTPKPDKNNPVVVNAESVAETSIIIYGGRGGMAQIRKTSQETGKLTVSYPDGTTETSNYQKKIVRGENTDKDKWRIDHKFPSAEYALIFNGKIFGILGGSVFTPRAEAANGLEFQMRHGLDALLRYKENGSTLELQKEKEKHMNVDVYVLDVTDKEQRKTRFYISAKFFRVLWSEYTENSVRYTRKYYDYRVAQGTLVPYRSVLLNGDTQLEENTVSTITFGQKVEDAIFDEN